MKYHGRIKKIKFSNNGWAAINIELDDKTIISAAGNIMSPVVGYDIELEGEIENPDYGPQIQVVKSKLIKTKTMAQFEDPFAGTPKAAIKRELGGKWALGVVLMQCGIAWICAFIVRMIGMLLGLG